MAEKLLSLSLRIGREKLDLQTFQGGERKILTSHLITVKNRKNIKLIVSILVVRMFFSYHNAVSLNVLYFTSTHNSCYQCLKITNGTVLNEMSLN